MKKAILILSMLLSSFAVAAEPTSLEVFGAILKDSGLQDAKNITVQQYSTYGIGETKGTGNNLLFDKDGIRYVCSHAFMHTHETENGEYLVDASVANCHGIDARAPYLLKLDNDYSETGVSVFSRVFYDNNTKFRMLTPEEKKEWSKLLSVSGSK